MSENDNNSKPDESKTAHAQDAPDRADTEQASVGPESEERVDPILLQLLVCPLTKTRLKYDPEKNELISKVWNIVIETHDVWGNPFPKIFPFSFIIGLS